MCISNLRGEILSWPKRSYPMNCQAFLIGYWMGLIVYLKQGKFSHCQASVDTLNEFRKESDSVAMFCDEMGYKATPEEWTKAKPVYVDYRGYCYAEGLKPLARKNFHRSEEHTSELQSRGHLVCRLLLEK